MLHRSKALGPRPLFACLSLLTALLGASPQAALAQGALDRVKARGAIVLAHREASIPFSYIADGRPVGYSLDLCHKIAEAIGRELNVKDLRIEYKTVTSSTRFDVLERGEADMECGSTTNTADRRKRVAFTIPHFVSAARLIVLSSKPYDRIDDLDGRSVASTAGTTNINSVMQAAKLKGVSLRIEPSRDHAEGVAWVLSGKVEAFAMDDVLLYGLRAMSPRPEDLKVIGKSITIEPYAIAFERGNEPLKRLVDAEMRKIIASKELHRLYTKWFQSPIPPRGVNLDMRMPYLMYDSLKYPTDFVPS